MAAAASVASVGRAVVDRWEAEFTDLMLRIGHRFARPESRRRVAAFLRGMLAGLARTNCWSLAEHAGERHPRGMQRLLSQSVWDTDGVREDLREYVVEHLGDPGGVLVVDETGDLKKGTATVGVQRQYTGTAGRIENSQVAVYLAYATPGGHALIDRALYLPKSWTSDPDRCAAAGVPEDTLFATKPALAVAMIERALAAGTPAAWATGDEVYGADPALRKAVAQAGLGFVLAVAKSHTVATGIGPRRAVDLAVRLPASAWQPRSAGAGAKGPRLYDWALIEAPDPALTSLDTERTPVMTGLLIRRSITTGEYAFYRIAAPGPVTVAQLVSVAGTRWKIEESFAATKELAALDEHQVRTWTSWHRWSLLAMLAHAFLSVLAHQEANHHHAPADGDRRTAISLIQLTRNEIRRLLAGLTARLPAAEFQLHWSRWRRHHQAVARACHYAKREDQPI